MSDKYKGIEIINQNRLKQIEGNPKDTSNFGKFLCLIWHGETPMVRAVDCHDGSICKEDFNSAYVAAEWLNN